MATKRTAQDVAGKGLVASEEKMTAEMLAAKYPLLFAAFELGRYSDDDD